MAAVAASSMRWSVTMSPKTWAQPSGRGRARRWRRAPRGGRVARDLGALEVEPDNGGERREGRRVARDLAAAEVEPDNGGERREGRRAARDLGAAEVELEDEELDDVVRDLGAAEQPG